MFQRGDDFGSECRIMRTTLLILILLVLCSLVNAATYKTNIGAYQTDIPGTTFKTNIGADQTDAPSAAEEEGQVIIIASIARYSPFAILIGFAYIYSRRQVRKERRYGKGHQRS